MINRRMEVSRAPAATPGPTWRPHRERRREELGRQYGAERRRVYWERGAGLSQDYASVTPTIWNSILAGIGIGAGFAIVNKIIKR